MPAPRMADPNHFTTLSCSEFARQCRSRCPMTWHAIFTWAAQWPSQRHVGVLVGVVATYVGILVNELLTLLRCCLWTTMSCHGVGCDWWTDCRPDTGGAESIEDRWREKVTWMVDALEFCLILYSFVNIVHNKASRLHLMYMNVTDPMNSIVYYVWGQC